MAKQSIQCEFCGQKFEAEPDKPFECPACGTKGTAAKSSENTAPPAGLSLKKDAGAAVSRKDCPICGTPVPPEAQVCPECGYSWVIGQQVEQVWKRRVMSGWIAAFIVGLILIVIIGMLLMQKYKATPAIPDSDGRPADESMFLTELSPSNDKPLREQPQEQAASARPVAHNALDNNPVRVDTPPPSDWDDPAKRLLWQRMSVERKLNNEYPMFKKEQKVILRMQTGQVMRGSYLGRKNNSVGLNTAQGPREIPLADLARPSRVRCDADFRKRFIDYEVQRRMLDQQ